MFKKNMDGDILECRIEVEYSDIEKENIKDNNAITVKYLNILERNKITILYENQINIAKEINNKLLDRTITNIMVLAKTQSGKTGSMCATIKIYLENNLIPIENIYIITGLSSCEWKDQTKERIPENLQKRVFHRDDLETKLCNDLENKKNVIIFMDEIQVAAKKNQTINKTFKKAGFLDIQFLYKNDIKILEYTATPDGTIYDLLRWSYGSIKILAQAGYGYISSYDLYKQKRVKQYKDLCGYDKETHSVNPVVYENIKEIKQDIDNYDFPLYHIIRTKSGDESDITISNFRKVFDNDQYIFTNYDGNSYTNDINKILSQKPEKHTIIFIKEMLRCAKTLVQTYKGLSVERFSHKIDDATIIQSLVGRDTGYTNNGFSICYTNIDSIIKYEQLWNSDFEDKTVKWNSKTTIYKTNTLDGVNTFNDAHQYNFDNNTDDNNIITKEPTIFKCDSIDGIKLYFKYKLKSRMKWIGKSVRKNNDTGFYKTSIKGITKVFSCQEIYNNRTEGLTENNYRVYPCYEDVTDKNTIKWWIIHY